jgi:hypothetical protein
MSMTEDASRVTTFEVAGRTVTRNLPVSVSKKPTTDETDARLRTYYAEQSAVPRG